MKTFKLTIGGEYELDVEAFWPDDDAPENPTVEDVIAVIKQDSKSAIDLIGAWGLDVYQRPPWLEVDGVRVDWGRK